MANFRRLLFSAILLAMCQTNASADSKLITRLDVLDAGLYNFNASHWIEQGFMSAGVQMYGENEVYIEALPTELEGADWIQTAFGSKSFTSGKIAGFTLRHAATVYVAHNDAITDKPEWLGHWNRTGMKISNSLSDTFTLYSRRYKAGEVVELGENGHTHHNMYIVAAVAESKLPKSKKPTGKIFDIAKSGALADGRTVNTEAIQQAIDKAAEAGGGTVFVDGGIYVTGTLVLKDNVTLWVEAGSILRGSADSNDYPQMKCALPSYRANEHFQLIYAERSKNITITGGGIIDGFSLREGYPWQGRHNEWERPRLLRMVECEGVTVKDISLIRSCNWTQYYESCRGIDISGIRVRSYTGQENQDGIDLSGCSNVTVRDYYVICGDDAVCIKALSMTPAENVLIDGVFCRYVQCNLVKIGTETHGDLRNVTIRNIVGETHYCLAVQSVDGSNIENVLLENIEMTDCSAPIMVRLGNRGRTFEGGPDKAPIGSIKGVTFRNIRNLEAHFSDFRGGKAIGAPVAGIPGHPIKDVTIENCDFLLFGSEGNSKFTHRDVPEAEKQYPEFHMFGKCPAWGLYFRHVDGLKCKDVTLRLKYPDTRPAIVLDDVQNYHFENVKCDTYSFTAPFTIWHKQDGEIKPLEP